MNRYEIEYGVWFTDQEKIKWWAIYIFVGVFLTVSYPFTNVMHKSYSEIVLVSVHNEELSLTQQLDEHGSKCRPILLHIHQYISWIGPCVSPIQYTKILLFIFTNTIIHIYLQLLNGPLYFNGTVSNLQFCLMLDKLLAWQLLLKHT